MTGKTLYEVYKKPSKEKIESWERIQRDINNRYGYDVVVRGSSYSYSVTYKYIDDFNHEHVVYITRDNEKDTIHWRHKDIFGVYSISAFNGYGILDISDSGDYVTSCYIYEDKISDIKCTKIYYTMLGRAYFRRNKFKLYLDEFLRI